MISFSFAANFWTSISVKPKTLCRDEAWRFYSRVKLDHWLLLVLICIKQLGTLTKTKPFPASGTLFYSNDRGDSQKWPAGAVIVSQSIISGAVIEWLNKQARNYLHPRYSDLKEDHLQPAYQPCVELSRLVLVLLMVPLIGWQYTVIHITPHGQGGPGA